MEERKGKVEGVSTKSTFKQALEALGSAIVKICNELDELHIDVKNCNIDIGNLVLSKVPEAEVKCSE
ncbi:MAG: hypothetical protein GX799_12295 [Crenarchaeota archaeon]|nr:hypothetical protein [Thermoproteota archaeon]